MELIIMKAITLTTTEDRLQQDKYAEPKIRVNEITLQKVTVVTHSVHINRILYNW